MSNTAHLLLRLGVAFAFLYPAIAALYAPDNWIGYLPPFLQSWAAGVGVSSVVLLHCFGFVEVVIALWILSGKKIFWPSVAATVLLLAIVGIHSNQFEVLFRDLSIAAGAIALAIVARKSAQN